MRSGRVLAVLGAMVLVATACKTTTIVVTGMRTTDSPLAECPHRWEGKRGAFTALLPGSRANVPEFHDCQRLRRPDEGYGVLAAVFARDSLELVPDSLFEMPRGRAVALVYLPPTADASYATTYDTLGLTKTFACVVVRRMGGAGEGWIVPVDDPAVCASPGSLPATAADSPLDLRVLDSPIGDGSEIPPVARWDWDAKSATQYIGVRCGTKWCEIGVRGFESSEGHDPGEGAAAERSGYAFRGAYDEQRLAEFDGAEPLSSMNLGTVVPLPELVQIVHGPKEGEWTRAARVHLGPEVGSYGEKFNFAAAPVAPAAAGASVVSLCHGTDSMPCRAIERRTRLDVGRCVTASGDYWIANVQRPGARAKYVCVVYRKHDTPGFTIPPIVRWRWRADDETIWISCPSGCCEVNAES